VPQLIQRPVLEVLAEAAEIGLPETATVPARAFDPVLRPFIVKRVQRAIDAASARTTSKHPDHALRLAFLDAHPDAPRDLAPDDERAVLTAFRALAGPYLPHPEAEAAKAAAPAGGAYRALADRDGKPLADLPARKGKRWPITTPAAALLAAGALATAATFLAPRLLPSPVARFRKTALGAALNEPLTDLVVARGESGAADARAKLLAPEVKKQIGPAAFDSLTRAADELPRARASNEESVDAAMAPLFASVNDLDARLLEAKVPAFVHAYGSGVPGRRAVWLTAYFVERRDEVLFDDVPLRVVWGRRLDGLNLNDSTIYKARAEDWAILSLDRLEQELVQTLLAPLAKGAPLLPNADAREGSPRAVLSDAASRAVSDELSRATKVDRSDAEALHKAIAQRNEIAVSLNKIGYSLAVSSGIELSSATVERMTRAKRDHREDAALIEDFLRVNERAASYRRDVAPAVVALGRLEEEEMAGLLVDEGRFAAKTAASARLGDAGESARGRLHAAASLAILASEPSVTKLALYRLVKPVLDHDSRGISVEASAGALAALLRALELDTRAEPEIDDTAFNALTLAFDLPPAKLREAAEKTYAELFGRPAPKVAPRSLP